MTHGEMIAMRRAGFTYQEIADKSGVPFGTVRSRLQAWGIKPEVTVVRSRKPRELVHKYPRWLIYELYWECELSTLDIAYELCMNKSSVSSMMRRLRIPLRTHGQVYEVMKRYGRLHPPPRNYLTAERARQMAAKSNQLRKAA